MKLKNKVAIITGGSSGIGFGCARIFGKHGSKVVIASRGEAMGRGALKKLTEAGYDALFVSADVTVEADVANLVETTVKHFGRLDCIVNNAGWHPPGEKIDDISVDDFEKLVRLNLTSTFIGCKLAVPHLRKTRGTIINMSSDAGVIGQTEAPRYVTTKAGQIGLTKALALDLAVDGVRVNAVCPAGVLTPMWEDWAASLHDPQEADEMVKRAHPLGRLATIDEIGEVCAFLASDEASFITGQTVCPDGGAGLGFRG